MAERSQLQYQPITGPVWTEPVASKLAWLPSVQQAGRAFPPHRLGDFVQPSFAALAKPPTLEWLPTDSYAGRAESRRLGDFAEHIFAALTVTFDIPDLLGWKPQDAYLARSLSGGRADYAFVQLVAAPVFDPQTLEWVPYRTPYVALELRRFGDFQQPVVEALYRPEGIQWLTSDRYAGQREFRRSADFELSLFQAPAPYDPQSLEWMPSAAQRCVPVLFPAQAFAAFVFVPTKLRRNSNLDGLTASGPFFRDPLDGI